MIEVSPLFVLCLSPSKFEAFNTVSIAIGNEIERYSCAQFTEVAGSNSRDFQAPLAKISRFHMTSSYVDFSLFHISKIFWHFTVNRLAINFQEYFKSKNNETLPTNLHDIWSEHVSVNLTDSVWICKVSLLVGFR